MSVPILRPRPEKVAAHAASSYKKQGQLQWRTETYLHMLDRKNSCAQTKNEVTATNVLGLHDKEEQSKDLSEATLVI
jgi:hypothetical protein